MGSRARSRLDARLAALALALAATTLAERPPRRPGFIVIFTVNSTGDAHDANPGDGICETAPGNGVCTLRAAIDEANVLTAPEEINFDP
ncbi:MAG TPA: CSLREA domain-containing protein, partial [Thermoanaerobaculia bacterium]|nr:CSLREA domain-containing protein [Thermoanaerobaculia bacterium]